MCPRMQLAVDRIKALRWKPQLGSRESIRIAVKAMLAERQHCHNSDVKKDSTPSVISMKYIVILGDGMADEPLVQLGGKTPLEYAKTPNMDRMAQNGACGMFRTIPDDFEAGSDIANMSILGYAPEKYYTGRGPLEAMSMGIELDPG